MREKQTKKVEGKEVVILGRKNGKKKLVINWLYIQLSNNRYKRNNNQITNNKKATSQ